VANVADVTFVTPVRQHVPRVLDEPQDAGFYLVNLVPNAAHRRMPSDGVEVDSILAMSTHAPKLPAIRCEHQNPGRFRGG
jgi:hypothetical protein